jgi:hypothetical protein
LAGASFLLANGARLLLLLLLLLLLQLPFNRTGDIDACIRSINATCSGGFTALHLAGASILPLLQRVTTPSKTLTLTLDNF